MMDPLYDREAVRPLWDCLCEIGFESATMPEAVAAALNRPSLTLLFINSVCGCAARSARPGVGLALQHARIPDYLVTVFAGVDREAVQEARSHMPGIPPSSPCVALFRDGQLLEVVARSEIESRTPVDLANRLIELFVQYGAARPGPSVPAETFETVDFANVCSSGLIR